MDEQKPKKAKKDSNPIEIPTDIQIGSGPKDLIIKYPTPQSFKETVLFQVAPPEVKTEIKKEIKKRKEELKSFALNFATDAVFTVMSFLLPEVGVITAPARLMRMGKTAEAIAGFLANVDKLKAFKYLKPFAEEFKTATVVWGGEHLVSQFTDKVKPKPLLHVYQDFLLGRGFLEVAGKGLKAGFKGTAIASKKLIDYAYGKFPKLPEHVEKTIGKFYETFTGMPYDAWKTVHKLGGGVQSDLLMTVIFQRLFSVFKKPEVAEEFKRYSEYLQRKIHKGSEYISEEQWKAVQERVPGFNQEKLKQLSDVVYLYLLKKDPMKSPPIMAFAEKTLQGEFNAPVFNKEFWEVLKTELKDIWGDAKNAFVENNYRIVKAVINKAREGIKIDKKKPVKEKVLDNKARIFLRHLYTEDVEKFRSGKITVLHYLFKPLFELYGHDPFTLLTEGLKVNVNTKKLAQMVETLMDRKQQSFSLFLEKLGEYAYKHATDLSFIRDRAWQLLKGDLRGFDRLWNKELKKVAEDYFERYIPRYGFKHYMLAPAIKEAKFTDVVDALDLSSVYSENIVEHMRRFAITQPLKRRFYDSVEDILSIGIPKAIVDTLKEYPHLINEPTKLAEAVAKEFGLTGGLTVPKWITNKFVIPIFLNNLYKHIDKILADPVVVKKLGDPMVGKQEFYLMDKKVKMTTGMLDAIKNYFLAITGNNAQAWRESKLYSFNSWMKRFILMWSVTFHGGALSLAGLATSGKYRITGWDIVGRAFLDSMQVMTRGLSHPEFAFMAREVNQVINDLAKQGHKVHEIILSGFDEGENLWALHILEGRRILHDLLQKGDLNAFKEAVKEFEKHEREIKVDKVFSIFHAPERWLWAGYYQALKLRVAYNLVNAYKNGMMTTEDLVKNLNTINYIFGGLHTWFYVDPKKSQLYRFFFFAPDWYLTLFHNFRTWLHGDAPLVANFFPSLLRMRFYLSVYANYAFNGHSPWDNYNLQDPKEWLRIFLKDWPELFKIHIPIVDTRGHYRVFTLNLLGFDIEPLEMIGLMQFTRNLYEALTHPTMSIDQRFLKVSLGTLKDWIEFWFRKGSMMTRLLIKMYEATKPKFSSTKEEGTTLEEAGYKSVEIGGPLVALQTIASLRYPYKTTPELKDAMRFAIFLNMFGMKTQVHENLTGMLFENRHRPQVVYEILNDWLNIYRKVKQAQKEIGLDSPKAKDVYKSLIVSLSHAYYNYYLYPWLKKHAHKSLKEIQKEAREILRIIGEDIKNSAYPDKLKYDLWHAIQKRFQSEIRDAYKAIAKRDLPDIITKKIEKDRQRKEVE